MNVEVLRWPGDVRRLAELRDLGVPRLLVVSDEDEPPIIDTDKFVANAKRLADYCAANPTVGLITATDKLFGN